MGVIDQLGRDGHVPPTWPWGAEWWKPKEPRRDLVRAGALIIAEIERLDRREGRDEPCAAL